MTSLLSASFSQTLRALAAERQRRSFVAVGISLALLAAWATWFFAAKVLIVETSEAARLEVFLAAHAIDAPVSGRIVSSKLAIGLEVETGDVLVELDAETEKRRVQEEATKLATVAPQIEAERAARLHDSGTIAELEVLRKKNEAERQRAAAQALSLDVDRQQGNQKTRESQARARIEDMRRDLATLEGRATTTAATIDILRYEIDRRTIRAPIAGRIGDTAELRPGAFVKEGDKLGAVVPKGDVKVVAEFSPAASIGRVRVGQKARIRLDGYPWIEYGTLAATVSGVGNELRGGHVRIELAVVPDATSTLPLEHGLPGVAEVEVERVAPATLVARAVGKMLARRTASPAPASSSDRLEARP